MQSKSLGSILKAALIAGLAAGVLVSVFHFAVTEPVMDQAIEIEEQLRQVQQQTGETILVDRDIQKTGLFLGFIMYGITWSLLFGAVYHAAQNWRPSTQGLARDLFSVLLAGWSVALLPFLKYPANPPGVGDPETIQYRQIIFLGFIVLSVANSLLGLGLYRFLGRRRGPLCGKQLRRSITLAVYALGVAILFIAIPANPDAVEMPAGLVWTFRALSLAGLTLFWVAFAVGFAWLLRRSGLRRARHSSALDGLQV